MDDLLRQRLAMLTLRQKVRLLTGADFWSLPAEPAIGLRRLIFSDGPAGVRGELWDERAPSLCIPSASALAATWDEARIERIGQLLAGEARRKGVDVILAPTVNLHRTPRSGRHFEYFSEDPLLSGRIGSAYVRGIQSGGVGAMVKHFVANDSETERLTVDVRVDERVLRELYLAPFEMIVREAQVWAVMAAYNAVNGTPMVAHPLLSEVLKREWGFAGVVVSDWFAARSTEASANGGLDVVMPGPCGPWGEMLVAAVEQGRVSARAIDDKLQRILRLAGHVGALEGIPSDVAVVPAQPPEQTAIELRTAAAAGFVLLRNADTDSGPVLPLDVNRLRRVAVLGPNAAVARTLGGGSATVFPAYAVSPLEGLREVLAPHVYIDYGIGVPSGDRIPAAAIEMLRQPDGASAGVELRFLAADGSELKRESRAASCFTWMGRFSPDLPLHEVATIELHTWIQADEDGIYLIGASGVGEFQLTLNEMRVLDCRIELPKDVDPIEALTRPPQRSAALDLRAGEIARLVLRYRQSTGDGAAGAEAGIVTFHFNLSRQVETEAELEKAVAMAAVSDVAIVVVGTTEQVESEGFDRQSLSLPGRQDELVARVAAVNPRTVVVVNAGAPVWLPWADRVAAVLMAWFPGQEAGHALADVLLGKAEPGGRLPTTWPKPGNALPSTQPVDGTLVYREGLQVGYRASARLPETQFCFGHGLGYTTWEYLKASASQSAAQGNAVHLTALIRNSGGRCGSEVVQVYLSRPDSAVDRPVRWLAGFSGVTLNAGEESLVSIVLPPRAFAHWDVEGHRWTIEPGVFLVEIGRSAGNLPLRLHVDIDTSMVG